jgi:hypothetical protein
MPTPPAGAKKPQDKKPSQAELEHEQIVDEDRALAGMPPLHPAGELRIRERNKVMAIAMRLQSFADEDGQIEIDLDDPKVDPEKVQRLLDVMADADDFAESIAVDPDDYVVWARRASYAQFSAILTRYGRAVGELSGSSN